MAETLAIWTLVYAIAVGLLLVWGKRTAGRPSVSDASFGQTLSGRDVAFLIGFFYLALVVVPIVANHVLPGDGGAREMICRDRYCY